MYEREDGARPLIPGIVLAANMAIGTAARELTDEHRELARTALAENNGYHISAMKALREAGMPFAFAVASVKAVLAEAATSV